MKIEPIRGEFVGRVSDLCVDGPLSASVIGELTEALDRYLILIFPKTRLGVSEFVGFGRCFGELEPFPFAPEKPGDVPAVTISNLDDAGHVRAEGDPRRSSGLADALWHTDNSYRPMRARYSMLVARTIPSTGGGTEFCDTRAAYDALPNQMKEEIEGLVAEHSIIYSRELVGFTGWTPEQRATLTPVVQPLVMENPRTLRRSLYLASHIAEIHGWSTRDARELVRYLTDFATEPRFVYAHTWHVDDLVIWDDRATMHRRAPYNDLVEPRAMNSLRVVERSHLHVDAIS